MLGRHAVPRFILGAIIAVAGCGRSPAEVGMMPDGGGADGVSAQRESTPVLTLPMRGTWDNEELGLDETPPAGCLMLVRTAQTGEATHLGTFQGRGGTCVTTQGHTDSPPFWHHAPAPPYALMDFTNEMVWTAANGDELWLRPNGGVFVLSLANGAASVRGHLTIAGGTGRFEDAAGSLSVTGGRDPGEPADHLSYEGEIRLRAGAAGGE